MRLVMPSASGRQTDDGRGDREPASRLGHRKNPATVRAKVMVLEQALEIGGRVQTLDIDGYRVDKGFKVLLTAYQEAAEVSRPEHEMDLFPFAAGAVIHGHGVKQVLRPSASSQQSVANGGIKSSLA